MLVLQMSFTPARPMSQLPRGVYRYLRGGRGHVRGGMLRLVWLVHFYCLLYDSFIDFLCLCPERLVTQLLRHGHHFKRVPGAKGGGGGAESLCV